MRDITIGRTWRILCAVALLGGSAALATGAAAGDARDSQVGATAATVRYDLGVRSLPQPGGVGRFRAMPVRLWGVVGAPAAPGPHPVVVIAHGAHGDGCPGEFAEWPCFAVEQRNDIGLTGLVRALVEAGFVAIAPDVNGAYTGGYGEPREKQRFRQIVDATLVALDRAGAAGVNRFGLPLAGRVDLGRVGVVGHSRGGMNVARWATGRATVRSALLVAPFFDPGVALPDIPTTVLVGTCDGDTRLTGGRYITAARRAGTRTAPAWRLAVARANHNFYNRTLVRLRLDDAREDPPAGAAACVPGRRPTGAQQQVLLASVARDHFRATLLGSAPASWQDLGAPLPSSLYDLDVSVARYPAG